MRRAIFFDVGNTLVADPFDLASPSVADFLIESGQLDRTRRQDLIAALSRANSSLDGLGWSHFWGEPDILGEALRVVSIKPSKATIERCLKAYRDRVSELYGRDRRLLALTPDELQALLRNLREAELKVGVISDERTDSIPRYASALGIDGLIDVVVTSEEAGVEKPNPQIFQLALRRAGVYPGQAVYVGNDYQRDIEGARNAGMRTVYFVRFNKRPPRPTEKADLITDDLHSVASFLGVQ